MESFVWRFNCILTGIIYSVNIEEIWLCCEGFKEKVVSKICIIKSINDGFDVTSPICTIDSQVLCIKGLSNGTVLAGTLESMLYSISTLKKEQLWSVKLSDSILDIVEFHDTVLCALADGYIAVLRDAHGKTRHSSDPTLIRIGANSIQCMLLTPYDHVWIGCGKTITIISSKTHEVIKTIEMSDSCNKVTSIILGTQGVWIGCRFSSMICLYDAKCMVKLIELDYLNVLNVSDKLFVNKIDYDILTMSVINDQLWIGTRNNGIHIFSAIPVTDSNKDVTTRDRSSSSIQPEVHGDAQADDGDHPMYTLTHVSHCQLVPLNQEICLKIKILMPIRFNGRLFVISCAGDATAGDKAVKLWQLASTNNSTDWNCTSMPECYDCVMNSIHLSMSNVSGDARSHSNSILHTIKHDPKE
jgi:hypothetical protein